MQLSTTNTILAIAALALFAGCRTAEPAAQPELELPAEMPRYEFRLALGYDKNDEVVLKWLSERPARPEGGEPLAMQCDFTIVIEENGPMPTSVSISQTHGIDGRKDGDGIRITSEALVEGEMHRDEQVAGDLENIVWTARYRFEMSGLDIDRDTSTASGSIKMMLSPGQPGWHVKHTWLILRTSGGEEVQVDLFG